LLQRELRLQGDGLGGELRRFWPGFTNSMWLGGNDTEWDFMDMFPYEFITSPSSPSLRVHNLSFFSFITS